MTIKERIQLKTKRATLALDCEYLIKQAYYRQYFDITSPLFYYRQTASGYIFRVKEFSAYLGSNYDLDDIKRSYGPPKWDQTIKRLTKVKIGQGDRRLIYKGPALVEERNGVLLFLVSRRNFFKFVKENGLTLLFDKSSYPSQIVMETTACVGLPMSHPYFPGSRCRFFNGALFPLSQQDYFSYLRARI